jgi:hypothetical protein
VYGQKAKKSERPSQTFKSNSMELKIGAQHGESC